MEKTFTEVIRDIKEGEVWECEKINRQIIKSYDGAIEIRKIDGGTMKNVVGLIFIDEKYKLQRKEYTFQEAFKAYEEGKEIESVISNTKFRKQESTDGNIVDFHWVEGDKVWWNFAGFDLELIRGKWYINN